MELENFFLNFLSIFFYFLLHRLGFHSKLRWFCKDVKLNLFIQIIDFTIEENRNASIMQSIRSKVKWIRMAIASLCIRANLLWHNKFIYFFLLFLASRWSCACEIARDKGFFFCWNWLYTKSLACFFLFFIFAIPKTYYNCLNVRKLLFSFS